MVDHWRQLHKKPLVRIVVRPFFVQLEIYILYDLFTYLIRIIMQKYVSIITHGKLPGVPFSAFNLCIRPDAIISKVISVN